MRQARTRILSLLLALTMCLSLLPATALAEEGEDEETYTIYFDANGGKFPDGTVLINIPTTPEGVIQHAPDEPSREGYIFTSWGGMSDDELKYHVFTDNETVEAVWEIDHDAVSYTVTFDAAGGKFPDGAAAMEVRTKWMGAGNNITETPPDPVREGYVFAGWEIDAVWNHDFTSDATVRAKWSKPGVEEVGVREVWFHLNGGTVVSVAGVKPDEYGRVFLDGGWEIYGEYPDTDGSEEIMGEMMTDEYGQLIALPVIEREGYIFDGWYTAETGGVKAGGETVFLGAGKWGRDYLWARWRSADVCVVTFDLNGAAGDAPKPKEVNKGDPVELPVLRASNAKFLGWGYSTDGKTLTEWKADDPVTGDVTLYAMWELEDDVLKGLTYQFGNSRRAFNYSESYVIPLERYEMVFGKTQGQAIYNGIGDIAWGGSCYGMAATSGMFFHGGGTAASSFRSGAEVPYDLFVGDRSSSLKMSLTEYIEAVFVSQYADRIQDDYEKEAGLDDLAETAEAVRNTKSPVMIAIRGLAKSVTGEMVDAGHAVLGYDVVDVDATESRLMVYDPNFPNTERYITLTRRGGSYTSWYYNLNDMYDWGTGQKNNSISVVPYEDYSRVWNNRTNRSNTPALFSTNARNASILDGTGAVAATIKNGELTANRPDIQPVVSYGVTADGTAAVSDASTMWLPAGQYTIETTDGSPDGFRAVLADVGQSASVSTSASAVTFAVSDGKALNYVRIDEAGAGYDITLYSTMEQGYGDARLTGTTAAGGISFAQISGVLYEEGADGAAALMVEGKTAEAASLSGGMPDIAGLLSGSAQAPKPSDGSNPFTDVAADAYYYDAVLWAAASGVTGGTSPTTFSPNESCTRAQIVTFLWRAAGEPKPSSGTNPFTDVAAGAYYYDAVLWAAEKGITGGTSPTTFSPNASCTRGQMVAFLWRYAGEPKASAGTNPFTDVAAGAYYYDAVLWAAEKEITGGTSPSTFSPSATVSRAQTVTFLYRSQGK